MAGTGRTRTQRDTGTRRGEKGAGSRRVPVTAPKGNPALLYGGIGGGALLLLIIIAAASGGKKEKPVVRPKAEPVAVVEPKKEKIDTGMIIFICANTDQHPDEEMRISLCPCGARARFHYDAAQDFVCLKCQKVYDRAQIKCLKCGKAPKRTNLKPIPD